MAPQEQDPRSSMVQDSDGEGEDSLALDRIAQKPRTPLFIYVLTFLSAIGGFLFGYDTGVVSGAMVLIRDEFHLDNIWHEAIVSATIAAAWLFALIGGFLTDFLGRKPVIIIASLVFTTGAVIMGLATGKQVLLVGRMVVGVGIGFASMVVPVYISEAAPPDKRGQLGIVNSIFITGGQFSAALVCGGLSRTTEGWRYMLGLSAIPSTIQFFGFLGMPESPRWLVSKGRDDEAARVLRSIRGKNAATEEELEAIKTSCSDAERSRSVLLQILTTASTRRALTLGCLLQCFQQVAAINTVMYYSASIIEMAGVHEKSTAIWLSAATAGVNFLLTFVGLWCVERGGRRPLVLGSMGGVILALILIGVGFQLTTMESIPTTTTADDNLCFSRSTCSECISSRECGFCFVGGTNGSCSDVAASGPCTVWAYDWCPTSYSAVIICGMALYLFFFAPGLGSMPWVINSEIYPLWARSTCNSIATSVNWSFNLIVSISFLTLTEAITRYGTFYLYASLSTLGLILFFLLLPETKGRSLEEMEGLFAQPWYKSGRGSHPPAASTTQYVHIRGLNRPYYDSSGSDGES